MCLQQLHGKVCCVLAMARWRRERGRCRARAWGGWCYRISMVVGGFTGEAADFVEQWAPSSGANCPGAYHDIASPRFLPFSLISFNIPLYFYLNFHLIFSSPGLKFDAQQAPPTTYPQSSRLPIHSSCSHPRPVQSTNLERAQSWKRLYAYYF